MFERFIFNCTHFTLKDKQQFKVPLFHGSLIYDASEPFLTCKHGISLYGVLINDASKYF